MHSLFLMFCLWVSQAGAALLHCWAEEIMQAQPIHSFLTWDQGLQGGACRWLLYGSTLESFQKKKSFYSISVLLLSVQSQDDLKSAIPKLSPQEKKRTLSFQLPYVISISVHIWLVSLCLISLCLPTSGFWHPWGIWVFPAALAGIGKNRANLKSLSPKEASACFSSVEQPVTYL